MTAQVAILNKEGVALAADSAVSIGGTNAQKVFPSAQKIFPLSLRQPVAAMIYNHATLVGVPWETIFAMYRAERVDHQFDTLRDYADDFLNYVRTNPRLFSARQQEQYLAWMMNRLFAAIRQEIDAQTDRSTIDTSSSNEMRPIIARVLELWEKRLRDAPISQEFDGVPHGMRLVEKYRGRLEAVARTIFEGCPLEEEATLRLMNLVADLFIRDSEYVLKEFTGVVIAGFGTQDLFPALQHFIFEGVVGDVVRHQVREYVEIDFEQPASVVPFAQSDGVQLFMDGIDPRYARHIEEQIKQLLVTYPVRLCEGILDAEQRAKIRERIEEVSDVVFEELQKELAAIRRRELAIPILNVLAAIPKDELGQLAQALVSATAFRRRISLDAETVGGPVDVAVISKTDGFVWMRRKSYFDDALNTYSPRADVDEVLRLLRATRGA
jgi:hypothetical protein